MPTISDIVNLDDYPIADASDPLCRSLVERYRDELDRQQYCVLHHFLRDAAILRAVDEVQSVVPAGYRNASHRNCYLQRKPDPSLPDDHPANLFFDASYTMIAADVLPDDFSLKQMYYWPPMIQFVSAVTRSGALYVSEDRYQPVNILCSTAGDRSAWHFDSWNAFTMTLLLQSPESGGDFQLVPNIRDRENPNHTALSRVLQGDPTRVVTVSRQPGSLVIFRGSTAVHRVTEVEGDKARLMGVFVYENEPGVVGDAEVNETVYGPRVASTVASAR